MDNMVYGDGWGWRSMGTDMDRMRMISHYHASLYKEVRVMSKIQCN